LIYNKKKEKQEKEAKLAERVERLQAVLNKWSPDRNRKISVNEFHFVTNTWKKNTGEPTVPIEHSKGTYDTAALRAELTEPEMIDFLKSWMEPLGDNVYELQLRDLEASTVMARLGIDDGGMSPAESARRTAVIGELYKEFDVDHDKNIDFTEFTSLARIFEGGQKFTPDMARKVYDSMDKNDDGTLDATEFLAFVAKKTNKFSATNFDTTMSQMFSMASQKREAEPKPLPPTDNERKSERTKALRKAFQAFGPGWAGSVSIKEFQVLGKALEGELFTEQRGMELFNTIDKDKMGFISELDFVAFVRDGKQFLSLDAEQFEALAGRLGAAIKTVVKDAEIEAEKQKNFSAEEAAAKQSTQEAHIAEQREAGAKYVNYDENSAQLEAEAEAEAKLASQKLQAAQEARAALDDKSEEQIIADDMGMSLAEYRIMMGNTD